MVSCGELAQAEYPMCVADLVDSCCSGPPGCDVDSRSTTSDVEECEADLAELPCEELASLPLSCAYLPIPE
jgi:hypothetical protein